MLKYQHEITEEKRCKVFHSYKVFVLEIDNDTDNLRIIDNGNRRWYNEEQGILSVYYLCLLFTLCNYRFR